MNKKYNFFYTVYDYCDKPLRHITLEAPNIATPLELPTRPVCPAI